jgi:ribose 5-phosphate isomerase B
VRSVRILAMRVHLGSDHAGLELKEHLLTWLAKKGHEAVDHGPFVYDAVDDYPPFCLRAAEAVVADSEENLESFGIVIGGSGNGEQIAANKVRGVRAALVWSEETAVLARDHNDANVISVGGRMHSLEELIRFVDVFLHTPYSNGDRHDRRLGQITQYERTGNLPPLPESALKARP